MGSDQNARTVQKSAKDVMGPVSAEIHSAESDRQNEDGASQGYGKAPDSSPGSSHGP